MQQDSEKDKLYKTIRYAIVIFFVVVFFLPFFLGCVSEFLKN